MHRAGLCLLIGVAGLLPACDCSGSLGGPVDTVLPGEGQLDLVGPLPDGAGSPDRRRGDTAPAACSGDHAHLHGDLWPMWYNMRMCCDAEHRALWRCERVNGAASTKCSNLRSHYQSCLADPNAAVCPNWGVCCFKASNGCTEPTPELLPICDTQRIDYGSTAIWGTYYGRQWGSSTTLHRFMTIQIWDATGKRIAAFSSNPGEEDSYMGGTQNHGLGAQGAIQIITDKLKDRFGSFACVELPAGKPITLQAIWMNDFCHTCASSYWSQPDTPCRTGALSLTPQPGRHYLWTERGLEMMTGCDGPPPEIARWLPGVSCPTR